MAEIALLRAEIDEIDLKLLRLLEKRFEIAQSIGTLKKKTGVPIKNHRRETEILTALEKRSKTISKTQLHAIWELLFQISSSLQGEKKLH